MAQPLYYVFEWFNEALDSHPHYAWIEVPDTSRPQKFLKMLMAGYDTLKIDLDQKMPPYRNKLDAIAEAIKLGDVAQQVDPERIGAEHMFHSGELNRALSVGMSGPRL